MEGMGEMMKNMGAPPPKALYPSLMDLPDLPLEKRDEVLRAAHERMKSGADLMGEGLDQLVKVASTSDYAAMQAATAMLREGVARFDSGLAANRAIAEGKDPRALATQWFKEQMNLRTTALGVEASGPLGLTWSHLFIMLLLVGFAAVMIAMYFFKMRRAAALFGRIEGDRGSPPPGSAPPLTGTPGPSAPAPRGGKTPPTEGKAPPPDGKPPVPDVQSPPLEEKTPPAPDAKPAAPPTPPVAAAKSPSPASAPAAQAKPAPSAAPPLGAAAREKPAATPFSCYAPDARAVFLAGTFNHWDAKATPMMKDAEGNWAVAVPLPPGHHEFKFVVDGVMCCEPGCDGSHRGCSKCVANATGTMNRVIEVA